MNTATEVKTYSKAEMINHFFQNAYSADDAFIQLPGQNTYQLVYEQTEQELERMMTLGKIINYVTFEHILSIVASIDNFLTPQQIEAISAEVEDFN